MSNGKDHLIAVDQFTAVDLKSTDSAIFLADTCNLRVESHFAAQIDDPLAQILHHRQQHIRTHMGLGIIENLFPCTGFHELLQHPADSGVIHTGIQLAVRECACTAFTELDITSGIQLTGGKESLHFLMSGLGILTALQNQRRKAGIGKDQCRKHTRRAKAYHHGAFFRLRRIFRCFIVADLRNRSPLAAGQPDNLRLIAVNGHIHCVDDLDIRLFTGIHAAPNDTQIADLGIIHFQKLRSLKPELMGIMLRRQRDIPYSYHFVFPPALIPAILPELHAHCKLYPPQSPSMSSTSPQA